MVIEILIISVALTACMGFWTSLRKHKITKDAEILKPAPEPRAPSPAGAIARSDATVARRAVIQEKDA